MIRLFTLSTFVLAIVACLAPIEPTSSSLVSEGEGDGEGEGEGEGEGDGDGEESLECESEVIDAPGGASCDAATRTCVEACGEEDETCFEDCLTSDPGGENCTDCLDDAFLSCVNDAGCQPEFDAIVCCSESCADADADACYTDTCATESEAYDTCIEQHKECFDADAICFTS